MIIIFFIIFTLLYFFSKIMIYNNEVKKYLDTIEATQLMG